MAPIALGLGALVGCVGGSGGPRSSLEGGLASADVLLSATAEPVYTVGTAISGEEWEMFSQVTSVFFDDDGNLFLLDVGAQRIVVVDEDGGLVRIVGRRGEGPGEFDRAMAAALLPDGRLAVFEFGMGQSLFEILDADGNFLETVSVDAAKGAPAPRMLPLADGRLLSAGGPRVSSTRWQTRRSSVRPLAPMPEVTRRPSAPAGRRPIHLFSLDGEDPQVVHYAWGLPASDSVEVESGATLSMSRAFGAGLHYAVLADGRIAVVDSSDYRVKFLTTDGALDGQFERPVQPLPVTESMKEALRARATALLQDQPSLPWPTGEEPMSAASREAAAQLIANIAFADVVPVIAGVAVDREGRIWIARTGPDGISDGPTDIVTPDGGYVGTLPANGLRIPTAFGPGGLMAYLETDDLGVQTIRVVRLVALGG